jgi:hypothetical protein
VPMYSARSDRPSALPSCERRFASDMKFLN